MARLRFVGRSGQKFNRNDLLGKTKKKSVTENSKLNLLTKIHSGLKEFTQITGTDSDEVSGNNGEIIGFYQSFSFICHLFVRISHITCTEQLIICNF